MDCKFSERKMINDTVQFPRLNRFPHSALFCFSKKKSIKKLKSVQLLWFKIRTPLSRAVVVSPVSAAERAPSPVFLQWKSCCLFLTKVIMMESKSHNTPCRFPSSPRTRSRHPLCHSPSRRGNCSHPPNLLPHSSNSSFQKYRCHRKLVLG